jgi:hypothetical protein
MGIKALFSSLKSLIVVVCFEKKQMVRAFFKDKTTELKTYFRGIDLLTNLRLYSKDKSFIRK